MNSSLFFCLRSHSQVLRVTQRIISVLEDPDQDHRIVSAAHRVWPPPEPTSDIPGQTSSSPQMDLKERERIRVEFPPSGRVVGNTAEMPFRPESSNPNKVFESMDWKLYVVDLVSVSCSFGRGRISDALLSLHSSRPLIASDQRVCASYEGDCGVYRPCRSFGG